MIRKSIILGSVFLLGYLCTGIVSAADSKPEFRGNELIFDDTLYATLVSGHDHGVSQDQRGSILDKNGQELGHFRVIGVDDFESLALVQLKEGAEPFQITRFRFDTGVETRYQIQDPDQYFVIKPNDPGKSVLKGMKGRAELGGQESAYFTIVGTHDQQAVARVTSNAAKIDFRASDRAVIQDYADQILGSSGFANMTYKNLIMLLIGCIFLYLGIVKDYEPLLLVPIGFGILVGNIPLPLQIFNSISVYMIDPHTGQYAFNTTGNSVLGIIYYGVRNGIFPPLIFLGLGAMTDFTALLSNPKSMLLGAAAQIGIFITFITAIQMGFSPQSAAAIGIIGGADGPTAIFLASRLAPALIGPIAIAAYSYMAMVPIIQPPIMKLLTTRKERLIKMKPGLKVSKTQKIIFPIAGMILTTLVAPGAIPLLGTLFFGNLLKESGVTDRLAKSAANSMIDICTILLGLAVGASTSAQVFLNASSVKIFVLGCVAFGIATAAGVLFAKFMNLFIKDKMNPLIGAAGVSAVPDSARVAHMMGQRDDPTNYLLMHAMGPNVAGVIGSAIAAGVFLGIF
jgi:oxaloacetate decarboxylase beta subunit